MDWPPPGPRHFREPNAWSYLANSSRDLALGDPGVNDSWNWTPATFTQSGRYPLTLSLAPVAGHRENSPERMHKDSWGGGVRAFLRLLWGKETSYPILTCTKLHLKQARTQKASSGRPPTVKICAQDPQGAQENQSILGLAGPLLILLLALAPEHKFFHTGSSDPSVAVGKSSEPSQVKALGR